MAVPMLDLKKHYELLADELESAALEVLRSGSYIMGRHVRQLELEIATRCQASHGIGVASGTDALVLALMALGIGAGDEVITTPYSFFATASCIHRVGAKPVFVDISPATYNLDVDRIAARITKRTKAIIPVHLFGQACDMKTICEIGRHSGLSIVEDAAQALGADFNSRPVGGLGTIGCFSFYPSKNLGGLGDAGMIVTNDESLAQQLRALRVHGANRTYYHDTVGLNSRLDEIQAAFLLKKLPHLNTWTAQRQRNAALYDRLLGNLPVQIPQIAPQCSMIYNQYVIQVGPRRDEMCAALKAADIGFSIYYPLPLHLQPCFSYLGYKPGDFPIAERMAQETLALPIFPELTPDQITQVCDCIRRTLLS